MFSSGWRGRPRGRVKTPPEESPSLGSVYSVSTHLQEIARLLEEINAATEHIAHAVEGVDAYTASLKRTSEVTRYVWRAIEALPVGSLPSIRGPVEMYKSLVRDIHLAIESNTMTNQIASDFDRHIDTFLDDFKTRIATVTNRQHDSVSALQVPSSHFFQNSHHLIISGGNFVHQINQTDALVRERSRKKYCICNIFRQSFYFDLQATVDILNPKLLEWRRDS
ncbi:hypothetical protein BDZ97DRAFT_1852948, partial [Flammula alnicola]